MGWPLAEVREERPRSGVLGYSCCLLDSVFRRRPAIRYDGPRVGDFGAVVLVSPIWALRMASPMRSFVSQRRGELPDVAVVSVMGGKGAPDAVAEIARMIGRMPILDTAFAQREVDDGSYAARLQAFGAAVGTSEESKQVVRPVILSPQSV